MAVSLSPACDPITSWYRFTYPLSWSSNCEVAEVLSDIPFISVGILLFGVSVLFLVLKRVSLSAIWLFFSVLLAFVAAALDLGQTLSMALGGSEPAIRAREVLFAFSMGFRFLFYWSYVAEPPLKARCATSAQRVRRIKFLTLERTEKPGLHSGSWIRWGLPGRLLGVSLLATIVIITALQIVWRVVPQFHRYSNVYAADAALELLVSFLLLLKLLLSTVTLDSPEGMLVHTLRECLAPISGLLVNIAAGVGNLLCFAFTESTVGRLLQAFEVYVIVVFVAVTALLSYRHVPLPAASSQGKTRRDTVFTLPNLPRESTFRITTPVIETPRTSVVLGFATRNKESSREVFRRSARRSLNHVSSWVSCTLLSIWPRHDEEVKLRNGEEAKAEHGSIDTQLRTSTAPLTQEPKGWTEHVHDASAACVEVTFTLNTPSEVARSMKGSIHTDQIVHSHRTDVPQRTVPLQARTSFTPFSPVPPSVPLGAKRAGSTTVRLDTSPVYGLGDIQSPASTSDSRTSLDELLRQQGQLDQSIEALKLFSTRASTNSSSSLAIVNFKSVELTRSSSIGQRTTSSDVSLSSFPIPPWLTTPAPTLPPTLPSSLPPSRPPSMMRIRGDSCVRLAAVRSTPVQNTYAPIPPETLAPLVDIPCSPHCSSIPNSLLAETNESLFASAGKYSGPGDTRYNVTSFIGGLATLGEPRQDDRKGPRWPTENESSVRAIQTDPGMEKLRPLVASPAVAKLSSLTCSSRLSPGDVDVPPDIMQSRIDDRTSRSLAISHFSQTLATGPGEKGMLVPLIRADSVQKMSVRPRPPPLALQSYGTPRIQAVGDE